MTHIKAERKNEKGTENNKSERLRVENCNEKRKI